ncbi:hypothetical protein GQ44DRAFT_747083 [Phaeosphaeriaceae sp. PMI808]|nr:hypothetical protein GQ44DRAFT_747083 [Phaeosphaeriaceae sp. PMI808]
MPCNKLAIISLWYENLVQREAESNIPNDRMDALATAISAPPQLVTEFIQSRRSSNDDTYQDSGSERQGRAISPSRRMSDSDSESYSVIEANNHLPPMILKPVEKYVSACRRRRSQNDGRRSVNTGPFRCTFGCGYRTKRAFDWRRHEETHEPQELWLCSLCIQRDTQNPFLVNRKDKFIKHVTDKHGGWGADKALAKSKVEFVPRAELGCSFCNVESINWDERCRHVLGHYEDEVEREMRKVKVIYEERADGRSISAGVE